MPFYSETYYVYDPWDVSFESSNEDYTCIKYQQKWMCPTSNANLPFKECIYSKLKE